MGDAFLNVLAPAFKKMEKFVAHSDNLFDQVAMVNTAFNRKLVPGLEKFLQAVPKEVMPILQEEVKNIIVDEFTKPIKATRELIELNPNLTRQIGLSNSSRYLIQKSPLGMHLSYA